MTDLPDVKLRALVNFPVAVTGRTAIDIEKVNGRYFIDLDVSDLVQNPTISAGDLPSSRLLVWNSAANTYQTVPAALAVTAGVASIDGHTGALDIGEGLQFIGDTLESSVKGEVEVSWFGTDYAAAVTARDLAITRGAELVFAAGAYNFGANQLDLAFNNLKVRARGDVTIRGTHANSVLHYSDIAFGCELGRSGGRITVEGTGLYGIELIGPDHGYFRARCTGATSKAFRIRSGVASEFHDLTVSVNEPGGFVTIPVNGISIEKFSDAYGLVTNCIFYKPIIEGVSGEGILNSGGGENLLFIGGPSEGGNTYGYAESYPARNNTLIGFDCEANTVSDFYLGGIGTQLINCRGTSNGSAQSLVLDNASNIINGGAFRTIAVALGHKQNILFNAAFGVSFTDAGIDTITFGMRDESVDPAVYQPAKFGRLLKRKCTVAELPTDAAQGETGYATNGRAFNGTGTLEGAGLGTGVSVEYNNTKWNITGTNVTVSA